MVGGALRCQAAGVLKDESGFHTSMTRLRSRAPKGGRAYGSFRAPKSRQHHAHCRDHAVGGDGRRSGSEHGYRGGTNAEVFEGYVERFLAPSLSEGQVAIMDELGAHRTDRVRELIGARGADLVLLPSYPPDLNPIEEAFSEIKAR